MTTPTPPDPDREQRLSQIILTLVRTLEKGPDLDRNQFLADHPEFAAELEEFFAGRDRLEHLAGPLRQAARAGRPPGGEPEVRAGFRETVPPLPPDDGRAHREGRSPGLGSLGDFRLL